MSEPSSLTLRPARPEDAPDAAPLIYAAGPVLFNALFGPAEADVLRFFTALFRRPCNPFSYENAVAAVQDGRLVGLAISADPAERRRIRWSMLWLAPRLRGPFAWLRRFPAVLDIAGSASAPPPGAFYLSILAVAPECRGRGIGSRLLEEVRRRAEASGSACLALHTEIDNVRAQRVYARHGYVETHRKEARNPARSGISGFLMMTCSLTTEGVPR